MVRATRQPCNLMCFEQEREQVIALIEGALQQGEQEGPEGQISSWVLTPTSP